MARRPRVSATDRREQILTLASELFAQQGYALTTTAQLATQMEVAEPVLYRHFASKRDLYVACVERAWETLREQLQRSVDAEPDPRKWLQIISRGGLELMSKDHRGQMWVGALTDRGAAPEVAQFARTNLGEIHTFVTATIRRAQKLGGVPADRDPRAEAWIVLSVGLLAAITGDGAVLTQRDLGKVLDSRARWLTPS